MKKLLFLTILSVFLLSSCLTPEGDENNNTNDVIETDNQKPESDTYVATEEEYKATFIAVDDFVLELNQIISRGNYTKWKTYLSDSYIEKYSSKDYLDKLSENPGLKNFNIKLKNLRDYFINVVVPSRSNVKIDEIQFITENKIKAYTIANNRKFVVYQLERNDSNWVITE